MSFPYGMYPPRAPLPPGEPNALARFPAWLFGAMGRLVNPQYSPEQRARITQTMTNAEPYMGNMIGGPTSRVAGTLGQRLGPVTSQMAQGWSQQLPAWFGQRAQQVAGSQLRNQRAGIVPPPPPPARRLGDIGIQE